MAPTLIISGMWGNTHATGRRTHPESSTQYACSHAVAMWSQVAASEGAPDRSAGSALPGAGGALPDACAAGESLPTGSCLTSGHALLDTAAKDLFGRPIMAFSETRPTPAHACADADCWCTWPENTKPASHSNASPKDMTATSPRLTGVAVGLTGTGLLGLADVQLLRKVNPHGIEGSQASAAASGHIVGNVGAAYRPEHAGSALRPRTLLGASPLASTHMN